MNHETSSGMQKKVKEKMERRLAVLPLQHIDTSVILEDPKSVDGRFCIKYLQKISYNYRGIFSAPVLSELFLSILLLENNVKRYASMDVVTDLISTRKIGFYTPKNIFDISKKIRNLDSRITPIDIEIIACAVEHKAVNLVTLDSVLIENTSIEKEFNIRIRHPKD